MPDDRSAREIAEARSDQIRDAAKWLVASFAAVGAVLVAGTQFSSIGKLGVCWGFSRECLALWVCLVGIAMALGGVVYAVWTCVELLVPSQLGTADLQAEYEDEKSYLHRYLAKNQNYLQAFKDYRDAQEQELAAQKEAADLDRAYEAATNDVTRDEIRPKLQAAADSLEALYPRTEALVYQGNLLVLSGEFKEHALGKLLRGAVIAAIGIGAFTWAANPPASVTPRTVSLRSANLAGANLTDASLVGIDLTGADLSGANLTRANLRGAILAGAVLENAVWDGTTCPDGEISDDVGGSCLLHLQLA